LAAARTGEGTGMNLEKVIFGAFVILACTLNFGFFLGEMDNPEHHHPLELGATLVVNLIAMTLKFGDRTHIGAVHLATSIVAVLQLLAASIFWVWATRVSELPSEGEVMATVVSLSGGALVANFISVTLLIGETLRRAR
jgi:Ca2+/H+ antiporter, TMEM165/GDT1 family